MRKKATRMGQLRFIAFVVTPMVFLGVTTLVSQQNFRNVAENQSAVSRTYEVRGELHDLKLGLSQILADHRGYIISRQADYLADYRRGLNAFVSDLKALRTEVRDNPAQIANVNSLEEAFRLELEELEELVRLKDDDVVGNAQERFSSPIIRESTARIRSLLQNMETLETANLARKSEATEQSARIAILTLWLNLALGLVLAGILAFLSWRYRRLQEEAQEAEERYVNELEAKVVERTAVLNATNAELEAFSYSVSHDLRAPLRAMSGYASMLEEDFGESLNADAQDSIARIKAASGKMSQLIDGLLRLSRITRTEMEEDRVNLSQIAQEILGELRARHPEVKAHFSVQSDLWTQGDPQMLRILMENLLRNAWKYSAKKDSIRISFGAHPGSHPPRYFVRDEGAGFDMEYAARLFEPFQRLHSEREFEGTGIGLAICKRIATRHGGRIWAEGSVGEGATVSFTLEPDQEDIDQVLPQMDRAEMVAR